MIGLLMKTIAACQGIIRGIMFLISFNMDGCCWPVIADKVDIYCRVHFA